MDAVHLVVPNRWHASLAIEAAGRGFHVLVEKPMATSTAEARAMIAAAGQAGVVLAVGHCMTWAPPLVAAAELVAAGRIGRPVLASIAASFPSPPDGGWLQQTPTEEGGGPLMDLGPHAIDALLRLLGPVSAVSARLGRVVHDYPAEDTATVILRFVSGAHGVVQTTFTCGQNDLVLQGTAGRLTSREWLGRDFGAISAGNRASRASGPSSPRRGRECRSPDRPPRATPTDRIRAPGAGSPLPGRTSTGPRSTRSRGPSSKAARPRSRPSRGSR